MLLIGSFQAKNQLDWKRRMIDLHFTKADESLFRNANLLWADWQNWIPVAHLLAVSEQRFYTSQCIASVRN